MKRANADRTPCRVFLAGATGVIGRRLAPLLVKHGFSVIGTTRSDAGADVLRALGAAPVIVDVYDAQALLRAVTSAHLDVVVHQLTDLAGLADPGRLPEALARNARIRREGTRNLVDAALAARVPRLVAQSIAWVYAPGPQPHGESDPLLDGAAGVTAAGVHALEDAVLHEAALTGIVLRYGKLYGPGTNKDRPVDDDLSVHVDAAAIAALLAINKGQHGAYNIVEVDRVVDCRKARDELEWEPSFRLDA